MLYETPGHCDSKDKNITTSCYTSPFIINMCSEGQHYIYAKIKKKMSVIPNDCGRIYS